MALKQKLQCYILLFIHITQWVKKEYVLILNVIEV
jgi:hypothetical protein